MRHTLTFRTRILLIVVLLALFPLALTGLWLTRSAVSEGVDEFEARLDQDADQVISRIRSNWVRERSDLLDLGDDPQVQQALLGTARSDLEAPESLQRLFDSLNPTVARATVRTTDDRRLWRLDRNAASADPRIQGALLVVDLPIHQRFPAARLGSLEAQVDFGALLGRGSLVTRSVPGAVLAAFDGVRGTPLLPTPFDASLPDQRRFVWDGDEWLGVTRTISEPPIRLVVAAPLSPFIDPFETAAERGAWWLAVIALLGLTSAAWVTRRLTRSLESLALAADAVSAGDLDTRVDDTGDDETSRVARAFNAMTSSLTQTLDELAAREKLAALGEFAASLAHEVRNPLTAIRLDLQQLEEALPPDSPLREAQGRALSGIERLDATVAATLTAARSEPGGSVAVDLRTALEAAAHTAEPAFGKQGAHLERSWAVEAPLPVLGGPRSSASLEQVFLNLLLNAAAALGPGGKTWLEARQTGGEVIVEIRDTGTGIPEDVLMRVFEPLYSTRADGTGLGLSVARRIVEDHQGRIELQSRVGSGTTVRVSLPLADDSSHGRKVDI